MIIITPIEYVESAESLRDKISRIDTIINSLFNAAVKAAETGNYEEYNLDDGQTKIRARYKDGAAINASIQAFENMRTMYINRLNGREMRLVDSKNFGIK